MSNLVSGIPVEKPKKQPPVRVRFAGITNCEWRTQENVYGSTDVVADEGLVIASVMSIPGDTPDFKFRRIHAEIIASSAKILQTAFYTRGTHEEDKSVQREIARLIERIDIILNEQQ